MPARRSPITLTPRAVAGLPSTITYGGTSALILAKPADRGAVTDLHARLQDDAALGDDVMAELDAVGQRRLRPHHAERADAHVGADGGRLVDDGRRMDLSHGHRLRQRAAGR